MRLSAAFTACANGTKLPIFTIIPRVNEIIEITAIPDVISIYKTQSTFDTVTIIKYFERIVIPYMGREGLERVLFILDRATCHTNEIVNNFEIRKFRKYTFNPNFTYRSGITVIRTILPWFLYQKDLPICFNRQMLNGLVLSRKLIDVYGTTGI